MSCGMTDKPLQTRRVSIKKSDPNKTALRVVRGEVSAVKASPLPPVSESIVESIVNENLNFQTLGSEVSKPSRPTERSVQPPKLTSVPMPVKADETQLDKSQHDKSPMRSLAAIIGGAGFFKSQQGRLIIGAVALFLIAGAQMVMPSSKTAPAPELASINRGLGMDDLLGEKGLRLGLTRRNPSISWFEKSFCTGSKMAGGCSNAVYHPYLTWWQNYSETEFIDPKDRGRALKTIANTFKKKKNFNKFRERDVLINQRAASR